MPKVVAKKAAKASAKYRRNIMKDPVKYEQYKAKDRERKRLAKEEGKIRPVNELCERSKRQKQKYMRHYMREYCKKKKEEAESDLEGIASKLFNRNDKLK